MPETPYSPITTFCLVRHGETDWNASGRYQGQEDTALNAIGREQARRAGLHLRQWPWDHLVASPLSRARDTAMLIGEAIKRELTREMPHFMERDYGEASGMTPAQMQTAYPDGNIPGLETRRAVQQRAMAGLDLLAAEFAGTRIIVVAHGGLINAILTVISNGEIGSGKTQLGNACISLIHHHAATGQPPHAANGTHLPQNLWTIEYINYIDHLRVGGDLPVAAHIGVG